MDCGAIEQPLAARPGWIWKFFGALPALFPRAGEPVPRLDLEEMPDRVKRDLGFLDGREPHYEEELRR